MVSVVNLSKTFGPQALFQNATFSLAEGHRVGLVGPNGAGKSTFFRILIGEEHPDEGEIHLPKDVEIGHLEQEWIPEEGDTVLEATLREHDKWWKSKNELREIESGLEQNSSEAALARYHDVHDTFAHLGGYGVEQTAKELLSGLGFKPTEFDLPAAKLSGGWRMRCHLAGLLLKQPDLLLLDEPTNHLDVDTVVWLEEFLLNYPHIVLVISHDRRLIERLATDILEFAPPTLNFWSGSLSAYEAHKTMRIEQLESQITNKEKEIERMEEFVRRFRAKASKARQAQNRLRTSEHFSDEVEKMKSELPVISKRPSRFKLRLRDRLPRMMIEVEHGSFGYLATQPLFGFDRCVIEGGKKIGIIGVNGVGKSTFLKSCAGELPLLSGSLRRSEAVTVGYFAQHRMEELPSEVESFEYLFNATPGATISQVRNVAASLGLTEHDLEKPLSVLSGGERARVSLSRILLSGPGLLLLDEPTNHLDMEACDALVRGLADYEGTVLVVSHDRDFLDLLVEYVLEITPGKAILHHGNYSEWHSRRAAPTPAIRSPKKEIALPPKKKDSRNSNNTVRAQRKGLEDLERRMDELRKEKAELETKLCEPESPKHVEFPQWLRRQKELEARIEGLEEEWLKAAETAQ